MFGRKGVSSMLNVNGINVYYGAIHALKDVSFHVEEGEIVSLIGANGAGKTTTMHTISGLWIPRPATSPSWVRAFQSLNPIRL